MQKKRIILIGSIIVIIAVLYISAKVNQMSLSAVEREKNIEQPNQLQQNEPSFQASGDVNWNDTKTPIDSFISFYLVKINDTTAEARYLFEKGFFSNNTVCRNSITTAQKASCFIDFCKAGNNTNITLNITKSFSSPVIDLMNNQLSFRVTISERISDNAIEMHRTVMGEDKLLPPDQRAIRLLYKFICDTRRIP